MKKQTPKPKIVNLIATAELGQTVNLEKLIFVEGFLYDTSIYRCAYLKDKNTKSKVSIFSSGKMISSGSKNFREAKHDLKYASNRLVELGLVKTNRIVVKIQNLVATTQVGRQLDLERLSRTLPNVIYEPEQFPAAIYHAEDLEGGSVLIFANGKLVFAGLRQESSLEIASKIAGNLAYTMAKSS